MLFNSLTKEELLALSKDDLLVLVEDICFQENLFWFLGTSEQDLFEWWQVLPSTELLNPDPDDVTDWDKVTGLERRHRQLAEGFHGELLTDRVDPLAFYDLMHEHRFHYLPFFLDEDSYLLLPSGEKILHAGATL